MTASWTTAVGASVWSDRSRHHQVGGHLAQLVIHPGEEVVPGPVAPDPAPSTG